MAEKHNRRPVRFGRRLAVGVAVGAVVGMFGVSLLAVTGLVLAIMIPVGILLASAGRLIRPSRAIEPRGMLIGSGGVLGVGALRVMTACQDASCGQSNAVPLLGIAVLLIIVGAAATRMSLVRHAT